MSYPGGKAGNGVYQAIINQMPPHRLYIGAFIGAGGVLRNKPRAEVNIAIGSRRRYGGDRIDGPLDCFFWACRVA